MLIAAAPPSSPAATPPHKWGGRGQALVEYALILALIVLVVIVALLLTGKQVQNLYSNITATMCNYRVGC